MALQLNIVFFDDVVMRSLMAITSCVHRITFHSVRAQKVKRQDGHVWRQDGHLWPIERMAMVR